MKNIVDSLLGTARALKGGGIKTRLLSPQDEFWDRRLCIRTFGFAPAVGGGEAPDWRAHYVPIRYATLFRIFRHVGLGPEDVFVDFGCGLGRAVFAANWFGAKRAIGVEIDPALVAGAKDNYQTSRLRNRDIDFVCAPAEVYSPSDVTVVFMFHPFGPGTMQAVVHRLEAELAIRPRRLRIAYENPVNAAILDASHSWERSGGWPAGRPSTTPYAAMFWESRSP